MLATNLKRNTYFTIRKTLSCPTGYGLYECKDEKSCTLIACVLDIPREELRLYEPI